MKKTGKLKLGAETIRVLKDSEVKMAAGGVTNTCLGVTDCACANTFNTACPSAVSCTACSVFNTNCGCVGTFYQCTGFTC